MDNNLFWEELEKLIQKDKYSRNLKEVSPSTYQFAADENNHNIIFLACQKVLEHENSKKVSFEKVEILVKQLQKIARKMIGKTI